MSNLARKQNGSLAVPRMFAGWNPFAEIEQMRQEMDRITRSFFGGQPLGWAGTETYVPLVDMYETDDDLVVSVALPGMDQEDINLSVTSDAITITGERKEEKEDDRRYHFKEQRYGNFHASVSLPVAIKADKAKAHYKNGLLEVTLPKAEASKPKRVKIEVEDK